MGYLLWLFITDATAALFVQAHRAAPAKGRYGDAENNQRFGGEGGGRTVNTGKHALRKVDIAAATAVVGAGDKGDQEDHQAPDAELQYAVPGAFLHFENEVVHDWDSLKTI